MHLIEGLYFYELIMLILGILLFVALLIILIIYAVKGRSLAALLAFFLLPIIMVGFPAYQKISFENGKLTLEKRIQKVANNPSDSTARKELKQTLSNIQQREPVSNPSTLLTFGKAAAVLGDTLKALNYVDNALKSEPNSPEAERLKQKYTTPRIKIERFAK